MKAYIQYVNHFVRFMSLVGTNGLGAEFHRTGGGVENYWETDLRCCFFSFYGIFFFGNEKKVE